MATGAIALLPTEGMSTGLELDTKLSGNGLFIFRAEAWTQRLVRFTRGDFTMMTSDNMGQGTTYGTSLFWKYMAMQFDYNYQVLRRVSDILTNETAGPLAKTKNFGRMIQWGPTNPAGGSLALNQALNEIHSKNIQDIWTDFSISLVLLRNNTSIPTQYRNNYPYWIFNSEYAGYSTIYDALVIDGGEQFANWWEKLDKNEVIPSSWTSIYADYTGQTVIRNLPLSFNTDTTDLQTFAFTVVPGTTTITVKTDLGEWRVILVQFTSDGTPVGIWRQDGVHSLNAGDTHVFDLEDADFTETGLIRLVCVHVSLTDQGGFSNYYADPAITGKLSITRDGPPAPSEI